MVDLRCPQRGPACRPTDPIYGGPKVQFLFFSPLFLFSAPLFLFSAPLFLFSAPIVLFSSPLFLFSAPFGCGKEKRNCTLGPLYLYYYHMWSGIHKHAEGFPSIIHWSTDLRHTWLTLNQGLSGDLCRFIITCRTVWC